MEHYGGTFRKIREQKGYTMEQVANGIVSVSFLSKFEREQSDISLHSFVQLLEKLTVSIEEFFHIHHNYEPNHLDAFFDAVDQAYLNRSLAQLKELKEKELEKWEKYRLKPFQCNILMLEVYEKIISNEEIAADMHALEILYDYLFSIEVWGYYELRLYNSTMLLMSTEMVLTLSKTVHEKRHRFKQNKKMNTVFDSILLNTLIRLFGPANVTQSIKQYHEEIKNFFSYLENIPESKLLERVHLIFLKGVYEMKIGNKEKGIQMAEKALSTLSDFKSVHIQKGLENYFQLVLENFK